VWEFDTTQGWTFGVLVLMTVPSLHGCVVGAAAAAREPAHEPHRGGALRRRVSRPPDGESWVFIYFGAAAGLMVLIAIFATAWRWPRSAATDAGSEWPMSR
jgi:hypothetical protein